MTRSAPAAVPAAPVRSVPARWLAAVAAAVVLAEAGYWAYHHTGWRPAVGAVYSWPEALKEPPASEAYLNAALRTFKADRGGNPTMALGPNRRLVAYYFEWDGLRSAITNPSSGHQPEICNTALGYRFNGVLPTRSWAGPAGPVDFEVTRFIAPDGTPVFVFKNIWYRGLGNWENRAVVKPWQRLNVLTRHRLEEVRILSAGVFGVHNPEAAWDAFAEHVLRRLLWTGTQSPIP